MSQRTHLRRKQKQRQQVRERDLLRSVRDSSFAVPLYTGAGSSEPVELALHRRLDDFEARMVSRLDRIEHFVSGWATWDQSSSWTAYRVQVSSTVSQDGDASQAPPHWCMPSAWEALERRTLLLTDLLFPTGENTKLGTVLGPPPGLVEPVDMPQEVLPESVGNGAARCMFCSKSIELTDSEIWMTSFVSVKRPCNDCYVHYLATLEDNLRISRAPGWHSKQPLGQDVLLHGATVEPGTAWNHFPSVGSWLQLAPTSTPGQLHMPSVPTQRDRALILGTDILVATPALTSWEAIGAHCLSFMPVIDQSRFKLFSGTTRRLYMDRFTVWDPLRLLTSADMESYKGTASSRFRTTLWPDVLPYDRGLQRVLQRYYSFDPSGSYV